MTDDTMPFLAALLKQGSDDSMEELSEEVLQRRLMAYDIESRIGAGRYERNERLVIALICFLGANVDWPCA